MNQADNGSDVIRAKVNLETSQISWKDLQRYFASGVALSVSPDLDLVEVAYQVSLDNVSQIQQWMASGLFGKVTNTQAAEWFDADALLWAVVISPWVLVQQIRQPS